MRPASVMTIETTKASRGRSTKISRNHGSAPALAGSRRFRHDLSGPHFLDAVDDHLVAFASPEAMAISVLTASPVVTRRISTLCSLSTTST